jgi:hypothetical protein
MKGCDSITRGYDSITISYRREREVIEDITRSYDSITRSIV